MKLSTKVLHDGKTVDYLTNLALVEAERRLGYKLTIIQGSYNRGGVAASAGTHDGGGAVDLAPFDWKNKVKVMRELGFAAWHRTPIPGVWGEHVHCIQIGNPWLSAGAKLQVQEYYNHQDGLADHAYDTEWRPKKIKIFKPVIRDHVKVLFAPLHATAVTKKQIDSALNDYQADAVGFTEAYRQGDYLATKENWWFSHGNNVKFKDARGRHTAYDSSLLIRKRYSTIAKGSFISEPEATPLRVAPRRHCNWRVIRVGNVLRPRTVLIMNDHFAAGLKETDTKRWANVVNHWKLVEAFVKRMRLRYKNLVVIYMADCNYTPQMPKRNYTPEAVFRSLNLKWITSTMGWVAWSENAKLLTHSIEPRAKVDSDHDWIVADLHLV